MCDAVSRCVDAAAHHTAEPAQGIPVYRRPRAVCFLTVGRYTVISSLLPSRLPAACSLLSVRHGRGPPSSPNLRSFVLGRKVYVGNLTYGVSSPDLETMFAAFGSVRSAQVITDRDTGRSKGFGFVEMDTDEAAQAAIQGLNGKEHDGRPLTVNEARPREERGGGRGPRGGGRGGRY